jgi:hypothetical protein
MMHTNDMMDRCTEMMGSMMGGGMMGNGIILVVLLVLLTVWLVGLATVGALIFWGVRRFSKLRAELLR